MSKFVIGRMYRRKVKRLEGCEFVNSTVEAGERLPRPFGTGERRNAIRYKS